MRAFLGLQDFHRCIFRRTVSDTLPSILSSSASAATKCRGHCDRYSSNVMPRACARAGSSIAAFPVPAQLRQICRPTRATYSERLSRPFPSHIEHASSSRNTIGPRPLWANGTRCSSTIIFRRPMQLGHSTSRPVRSSPCERPSTPRPSQSTQRSAHHSTITRRANRSTMSAFATSTLQPRRLSRACWRSRPVNFTRENFREVRMVCDRSNTARRNGERFTSCTYVTS